MSDLPQTWHYGLVARWWAEFRTDGPELDYFRGWIERSGQPALDVACGTGRLLLPYRRAGLDVDGCDVSEDMLDLCRSQAEREGLTVRLYHQAMHDLDLPRQYRTIVVCGSFGLGGDRGRDMEALHRFHRHLAPGGRLVFDHYLPHGAVAYWPYWLKGNRGELPQPWPPPGGRRRTADGDEIEMQSRLVAFDPMEQNHTLQMRATLWRDGQIVAEEEHTLRGNDYFKNELCLMLERAGFDDVQVYRAYTEESPMPDDEVIVFSAGKPAA